MKTAVFTADSNGAYPIPAVKGGAVQCLVEHLIKENNRQQLIDMTIVSFYNAEAERKSLEYPNVSFVWIRVPSLIKKLDTFVFFIIRKFFKKKKSISFRTIFSLLYFIVKSSSLLKRNHYDKIIIENNIPLAWIVRLSQYTGEVFYHFHNLPRTNAFCKSVFNTCEYLCVSDFVADEIKKENSPIGPIQEEKVSVLKNCVDTELFTVKSFDVNTIKCRYGIRNDEKIILYVGRLSEEKGIDKLLESLRYVKSSNYKVLIVGSLIYGLAEKDQYQEYIEALACEYRDRIVFTGYISQSELPDLYNNADVAVLPSIWQEPAGLTMVEAMACGLPVITTQSGGIPEYVADCGFVLPINVDLPRNIAEKIDLLFSDAELRKTLSEKAVKRVEENFTTEKYFENFCNAIL
ncbi:MAG: glycosyltransferase family 4 protein [Bacteroidales bacterium]|nr:glycosyltransferase family 4 protein [Bacteroidales bacterium]